MRVQDAVEAALAPDGVEPFGDGAERLVPGDAGEAGLAAPTAHRVTQPAQAAQLVTRPVLEGGDVAQHDRVERVGGVELEHAQPGGAQVHAVDGPVVEAGHAEGAPVAHPLRQHVPGVAGVVEVGQRHLDHLAVVVGLGLADAVGRQPGPQVGAQRQVLAQALGGGSAGTGRVGHPGQPRAAAATGPTPPPPPATTGAAPEVAPGRPRPPYGGVR